MKTILTSYSPKQLATDLGGVEGRWSKSEAITKESDDVRITIAWVKQNTRKFLVVCQLLDFNQLSSCLVLDKQEERGQALCAFPEISKFRYDFIFKPELNRAEFVWLAP